VNLHNEKIHAFHTYMRTGIQHIGTNVWDMQAGIAQYLSWSGVNPLGDVNGTE